jgi:glyoxylase I family protein
MLMSFLVALFAVVRESFGFSLHTRLTGKITHLRLKCVRYGDLNHIGILTRNTSVAVAFYVNVLNFVDETHLRHELPYPGAFVRAGLVQLHLMELLPENSTDTILPNEYPGRDRHVAITVYNLDALRRRLDVHNVRYSQSTSGREALFCRDPDSNALEFVQTPVIP